MSCRPGMLPYTRIAISKGEKWMKDTSQACLALSTPSVTAMFAAAFKLPGGNDRDAISVFDSCTSILKYDCHNSYSHNYVCNSLYNTW